MSIDNLKYRDQKCFIKSRVKAKYVRFRTTEFIIVSLKELLL